MNAERRKTLEEATGLLDDAKSMIEGCRDEEQDYFDDMPENLQGSERGERAEEVVGSLDSVIDSIETALQEIDEAKE